MLQEMDRHSSVLAIDIGATKLATGLVSANGDVLFENRAPSPKSAQESLRELKRLGAESCAWGKERGLALPATGIACGGPLDLARGLVLTPPNLPDWVDVPIRSQMEEAFGLPAHLQNDAAAGALATYLWDNPHGYRDVVYITVSSGIGCGVILDGRLMTGHSGNGSELGHIPLIHQGRRCKCGQDGCVEAYVSGTSIGERYAEDHGEVLASREVAVRAAEGDATALTHWVASMKMLNRVVRAAADLFDPALLCVGGGVTDAPEHLLAPAFDFQHGVMSNDVGRGTEIRRTGFGRSSGVASAAAIAWRALGTQDGKTVEIRDVISV